ncbi:hypothetical protein [Streptomyces akebiae]|nr:hypothetical protein [Streptomyces akebiae]
MREGDRASSTHEAPSEPLAIHTAEPHRTDGKFVWCELTTAV